MTMLHVVKTISMPYIYTQYQQACMCILTTRTFAYLISPRGILRYKNTYIRMHTSELNVKCIIGKT